MDEQTGDFFNPPDDTYAAFAAPPAEDDNVGDVYYGSAPADDSAAFFNPPAAVIEDVSSDPAPIILGGPAPIIDEPTAAGVENVEDDDDEDVSPAAAFTSSEPTPMQKWNDEWQTTLLARKDEENAKKASDVETARAEIEAFQAEREKRREARMVKNRSEEQDKLEAIEADLENDNSWQKVVKMIELNQDSSDGAENTGRMRDVLVLLKNEPQRAEGLTA
eukprot:CAMPEP_0201690736 /NCGR_PEP_ID=MMETSP0578-20130828/4086_1 /ASSEMBLY_ACC=CAM_ASM_000663 /TAXON_ID=267565 /ORGANISM="Skeletonema grethea, Strain CCMP 1804" /LENGTH=219 /DNA_ID=CAMNT_0048175787 /DNA_START=84 /DNA_END=743 /DNA_ORIENTATION=-